MSEELEQLDFSNLTSLKSMFSSCSKLKEIDISNKNVSNITEIGEPFVGCTSLKTVNMSNWNLPLVTSMKNVFSNVSTVENVYIKNINAINLNTMYDMFYYCRNLINFEITGNLPNLSDISSMFYHCNSLKKVDFSKCTILLPIDFTSAFTGCLALREVNLSGITTPTKISSIFYGCTNLEKVDIRDFTFDNITSYGDAFKEVPENCQIIVKSDTERNWLLEKFSTLTNIVTVAELEESGE